MIFNLVAPEDADEETIEVLKKAVNQLNSGQSECIILPKGYSIKEGD